MKTLALIGPTISFILCFLGGIITMMGDANVGIGLFFIGVAFFVGPMLWMASETYFSKPGNK